MQNKMLFWQENYNQVYKLGWIIYDQLVWNDKLLK